jgi:hypothetical protein
MISREAEPNFKLFHVVQRIMMAMVKEIRATRGVAVLSPRTIASRGMASKASPKPNAALIVVEKANIAKVAHIVWSKMISMKAPEGTHTI